MSQQEMSTSGDKTKQSLGRTRARKEEEDIGNARKCVPANHSLKYNNNNRYRKRLNGRGVDRKRKKERKRARERGRERKIRRRGR